MTAVTAPRRKPWRPGTALVPTFVLLALLLSGCTGGDAVAPDVSVTAPDGDADPGASPTATATATAGTAAVDEVIVQRMREAARAMGEQPSARVSLQQGAEEAEAGGALVQEGDGVIDFTSGTMRMTMTDAALAGMEGSAGGGSGDGEMELLVTGDDVYVRVPAIGDRWVQMGAQAERMDAQLDPQTNFDSLADAVVTARDAGQEEIRGVPTTRYDLTVDLRDQLDAAPEDEREDIAAQMDALGATEVPMRVWIGEDDLVRRQQFVLNTPDPATGEPVTTTQTIEYFDFGVEVDITPPGDALQLQELMGSPPSEG